MIGPPARQASEGPQPRSLEPQKNTRRPEPEPEANGKRPRCAGRAVPPAANDPVRQGTVPGDRRRPDHERSRDGRPSRSGGVRNREGTLHLHRRTARSPADATGGRVPAEGPPRPGPGFFKPAPVARSAGNAAPSARKTGRRPVAPTVPAPAGDPRPGPDRCPVPRRAPGTGRRIRSPNQRPQARRAGFRRDCRVAAAPDNGPAARCRRRERPRPRRLKFRGTGVRPAADRAGRTLGRPAAGTGKRFRIRPIKRYRPPAARGRHVRAGALRRRGSAPADGRSPGRTSAGPGSADSGPGPDPCRAGARQPKPPGPPAAQSLQPHPLGRRREPSSPNPQPPHTRRTHSNQGPARPPG